MSRTSDKTRGLFRRRGGSTGPAGGASTVLIPDYLKRRSAPKIHPYFHDQGRSKELQLFRTDTYNTLYLVPVHATENFKKKFVTHARIAKREGIELFHTKCHVRTQVLVPTRTYSYFHMVPTLPGIRFEISISAITIHSLIVIHVRSGTYQGMSYGVPGMYLANVYQ